MQNVPRLGVLLWLVAAALTPTVGLRGQTCVERCSVALGSDDPVSMSIFDTCMNQCRAGAQRVILHYAALAISRSTMRVGAAHGQNSEAAAKEVALTNCRRNAAADCEVVNYGSNLCFALATSEREGSYGQAPDSDRARAAAKALAQCRGTGAKNCLVQTAPCAGDDPRWSSPLPLPPPSSGPAASVDPNTIGTWEYVVNPGRWVWEIAAIGTYEFHTEALDNAASHAGTFTARDGRWSLRATNGYSDSGTYRFEPPDKLIATGQLGTGTWHRIGRE